MATDIAATTPYAMRYCHVDYAIDATIDARAAVYALLTTKTIVKMRREFF